MPRSFQMLRPRQTLATTLTISSCLGLLGLAGCTTSTGTSTAPLTSASGASTGNGTAQLRQTQLGYVWLSQDATLRPLLGSVGAAYLGAGVTAPGAYVAAAASPVAEIALLLDASGNLSQMALPGGTATALGSYGSPAAAKIRFSPSGTAAVLFTPGGNSATVVTALTTAPQVHVLTAGGGILEAAVSDAGTVAALVPVQSAEALTVLHATGAASTVASLGSRSNLSFVGTSDDLVTVDSAANTMTLIHTLSTTPNPVAIPTANLLMAPSAVGVAATGRWAVAVNSGDASVVRVDLSGQSAPQRLACPVQPSIADPLALGAFRFTPAGSAAAWVADITATTPTLSFVPALPATHAASGI